MTGQDPLLNLAAFALQICLIGAAASLVLAALRIGSPGARYTCWRIALAACLTMPMLLQRPASPVPAEQPEVLVTTIDSGVAADLNQPATPAEMPQPLPWAWVVAIVIAAGAAVRGAWLSAGLLRLRILRRRGVPVAGGDYGDLQQTLGTQAELLRVAGLTQPATFGLWRPIILLPDTLFESPVGLRRAVVTHELFHVQRRDWAWVLAEELLRTALWFHPAIFWITVRIQLAREELVDELTVLATGNRKAYIEALLAFADSGRARPAPAFARRRHLFTRIVRLSKERVMSSPRIIISSAAVVFLVLLTGWYASTVFPIVSAATELPVAAVRAITPPEAAPVITAGPRRFMQGPRSGGAPRPGPAAVTAPAAPGTKPITPENPIPRRLSSTTAPYPGQLRGSGLRAVVLLQVTLDASGSISSARRMGVEVGGGDATDTNSRRQALDAFFNAASDAVRQWRYQSPADPPIAFYVSVRFEPDREAVATQSQEPSGPGRGGQGLTVTTTFPTQSQSIASASMRLEELRLQERQLRERLGPQHPDLMKVQQQIQEMERELERARGLEQNAAELRQRAEAVRIAGQNGGTTGVRVAGPGTVTAVPVRVGGNVRPPTKTKHVDPEYPPIAKSARVQGVVIMEVVIDEQGRVAEARILRSIPLLDQAALDAVRQWEFTPTLLNGSPVPIVLTTTVQFVLPEPSPQ